MSFAVRLPASSNSPRRYLSRPAIAFVTLLTAGITSNVAAGNPSEAPDLAQIAAAIEKQHEQIKSLSVEYRYRGEVLDTPEVVRKYVGVVYVVDEARTVAFKGGKRYYRMVGPETAPLLAPGVKIDTTVLPNGQEIRKQLDEKTAAAEARRKAQNRPKADPLTFKRVGYSEAGFDGQQLRRKHSAAIIELEDLTTWETDKGAFQQDYLSNLGLTQPDLFNPRAKREAERLPDLFSVAECKVQPATEDVEGHPCVVVRVGNWATLWLDPKLGYSIRRWDILDPQSQVLKERRLNREFREFEPGCWLPMICWRELCGPPLVPEPYRNKPLFRYVMAVEKLVLNKVPDELFSLAILPGVQVIDNTVPVVAGNSRQPISYLMPADPNRVDEVIAETKKSISEREARSLKQRWFLLIMLANVLAIVALVAWRTMKRKPSFDDGSPSTP